MNFKSFNLHPHIEAGIEAMGYAVPTPIQTQCIPSVLQNRDVMGMAQTGTGKTAAFVLPILQRLMDGNRKRVQCLIIAPTRELAEQTHDHIRQLGRYTKLKSVTVYGGVEKHIQIKKLRDGVEIVVACPGRLLDLMNQGVIDLSRLKVLVLDEADRMFDMGFLPDVREILKRLPSQRQTMLFSATMPDDIRALAREVLRNPVTVQVGDNAPVSTVSHAIYTGRAAPQSIPFNADTGPYGHGVGAHLHPHKGPRDTPGKADEKSRFCRRVPAGRPAAEQATGGTERFP